MDDDVIAVTIRTLDKSRQAEVRLPIDYTVEELIEASRQNWRLPRDTDFMLRCVRLGTQLPAQGALGPCGVQNGDMLEVVPLLEAGA